MFSLKTKHLRFGRKKLKLVFLGRISFLKSVFSFLSRRPKKTSVTNQKKILYLCFTKHKLSKNENFRQSYPCWRN